jgi:large subunit ribosomal protein L24
MKTINIKKGDKVIVLSGRDKGKTGLVERVSHKTATLLVEGVNIVKKHVKPSQKNPSGGIAEVVKPMPAGKVQLVCPNCGKPTRISFTVTAKTKTRVCKKCGKPIVETKTAEKEKSAAKGKGAK